MPPAFPKQKSQPDRYAPLTENTGISAMLSLELRYPALKGKLHTAFPFGTYFRLYDKSGKQQKPAPAYGLQSL